MQKKEKNRKNRIKMRMIRSFFRVFVSFYLFFFHANGYIAASTYTHTKWNQVIWMKSFRDDILWYSCYQLHLQYAHFRITPTTTAAAMTKKMTSNVLCTKYGKNECDKNSKNVNPYIYIYNLDISTRLNGRSRLVVK